MPTFRKKPAEVQAVLWLGYNFREIAQLAGGAGKVHPMYAGISGNIDSVVITKNNKLRIATLEGDMTASIGDYIIRGVKGELYPCKPDVFDMTYELVIVGEHDDTGAREDILKAMVERFLSWPLPDSVCSDTCVTMPGHKNRAGTNLLTYDEAHQMLKFVWQGGYARADIEKKKGA